MAGRGALDPVVLEGGVRSLDKLLPARAGSSWCRVSGSGWLSTRTAAAAAMLLIWGEEGNNQVQP